MDDNRPGNSPRGRWWWPIPPPPVPPPPAVTLTSLAGQIHRIADQLDRVYLQQIIDRLTIEKGFEKLMAQIDLLMSGINDVAADLAAHRDDLAALKTDFDAAVAALKNANIPPDLQPAIDAVLALKTGVDAADASAKDLDAAAKGLVQPAPTPAP